MTPEELEERIEEIAEDADKRLDKLEKFMGVSFLEGPQLSQMTPEEFAKLTVSANELPNGEYNFALYQALTNRILADQASVIAMQQQRIAALEARPTGSVTPTPQPEPSPTIPAQPSSGAVNIPGFGNGIVINDNGLKHLVFGARFDRALRVLYNHKDDTEGGHTYSDETLMQMRVDFEQDGSIGFSYWKPRKTPDGQELTPGPWDLLGGKGIVLRPGGQDSEGRRGKYAEISSGHKGRGLRFGVSPNTPNVVEDWSITIEPDGSVHTR